MNLGELRTRFYDFLQASLTKGPWTQAIVDSYVHDGHMRLFHRIAHKAEGFFRTTDVVNETAGQSTYNLPLNCYRVDAIERIAGGASTPYFLQRISYQPDTIDVMRSRPSGIGSTYPAPEAYYPNGQKSFTLTRASAVTVTAAFLVTYSYVPAKMTAITDVPFQKTAGIGGIGTDDLASFHDIIAWYAIDTAAMQSEESLVPLVMQRLREREQELDVFLRNVNTQEPRFVSVTDNAWNY